MNHSLFKLIAMTTIATTTTASLAQETQAMSQQASYIEITSANDQAENLGRFLAGAAPIVAETEPGTALWFALKGPDNTLAIFDVFVNEGAREEHFAGAVAAALKQNSGQLIKGGWDDGVVANVQNSSVLSYKAPVALPSATTATYIKIEAASGQSDALAELLTAAGPIVTDTEPKTLYWVALRLDEDNFAIFDIFADNSGREAHFAGRVANLLREKSSELVNGGWDSGVVANVSNFEILATK
ncbi:MAG: hypothetical protein AB8G16_11665 [Gammaproteobacteria bacterium]